MALGSHETVVGEARDKPGRWLIDLQV
jgi:hypothetical protein